MSIEEEQIVQQFEYNETENNHITMLPQSFKTNGSPNKSRANLMIEIEDD